MNFNNPLCSEQCCLGFKLMKESFLDSYKNTQPQAAQVNMVNQFPDVTHILFGPIFFILHLGLDLQI